MLLFEGPFGRILHTGDFRWEAEFAESMLSDEMLTWAPIDQLYIDNTYAHPRYSSYTQRCASLTTGFYRNSDMLHVLRFHSPRSQMSILPASLS